MQATTQGTHPAEVREVPANGVWAKLAQPCSNGNCDFREGDPILLCHPGVVRVQDGVAAPERWTLVRYDTDREATGSEAPRDALAWVSPQAFARFPARRPGDAR